MTALSDWIRDELRAHVRDMTSFQPTDFIWKWDDVEFQPLAGMLTDAALTPQRKPLLTCTHIDDRSIEFRVLAVQKGNTHEFGMLCEYQPALMFTHERVEIADATEIKRPMTEWLGIVARQLVSAPTISRQVDELVERVAERFSKFEEPYSEPRRDRLRAKLQQVAALALVLREGADHEDQELSQRTSLTDAHKDARHLAEHLVEISRGKAMRWLVGTIARIDFAWQRSSKSEEPHQMLQELWELAEFREILGDDYRTRARLKP